MLDRPQQPQDDTDNNTVIHQQQDTQTTNRKNDLSLLDIATLAYLNSDQQRLRELVEQADQRGHEVKTKQAQHRLHFYYVIKNFFRYLIENDHSTCLPDITTEVIEAFLQRKRPVASQRTTEPPQRSEALYLQQRRRESTQLKAFFDRAVTLGVIVSNPFLPLVRAPQKLVPKEPSAQTQADSLAFQEYLEHRVKGNLLSPGSAKNYYNHLCILLHDAEVAHRLDPAWPTELNGLFADPKWLGRWLMELENRSSSTPNKILARSSITNCLTSIRQIWLFLLAQGRAAKGYYHELKDMFRWDGSAVLLPGRSPQIIEPLSEAEELSVFTTIERFQTNPILKLRDLALFTCGIETTMRMDGLNSMQIENFRELEPGIFVCRVRIKRSPKKTAASLDQLGEDQAEWRDWYISAHAHSLITTYLQATHRTWQSRGSVWLTSKGKPLLSKSQGRVIRHWLKLASCQFTRPHVLRHTGIERLINKFDLPIPIVQAISQHTDPTLLLSIYAQRTRIEAFKDINQLFPAMADPIECEKMLLSISTKLNEISAGIARRGQEQRVFSREHAQELLELLDPPITQLTKYLGYEATAAMMTFSKAEYLKIDAALQSLGLSYQQVLGYEPKLERQTMLKPTGRRRKSLIE